MMIRSGRVLRIRARNLFRSIVLLTGIALALAIGTLSSRLIDELERNRHAPRDNVHWSILQAQTELTSLQLEFQKLTAGEDRSTEAFRTRFDIFYSRVTLLASAPIFAELRRQPFFQEGMQRLMKFLDQLTPIIDGGDDRIFSSLDLIGGSLETESEKVRLFVLNSIAYFARVSDRERRDLSKLLYSLGFLLVFLLCIIAVASLSLLRRSAKLERRTRDLMASESRMAATVSSALDAVIVADSNGTVLEFNEKASDCFGYARSEAIGRNLVDLIIPEHMRDMHNAGMERFRETGEAKIIGKRIEIEALHADGHHFPVELAVGSATNAGETIFVAYARDITKRRRDEHELRIAREEAEAADQAKSRFLAVMSHEMRTPLNGITGVLQLLADTRLDDHQRTLIETAERSGEILLDLINDVLDISKMEAGKLHLNTMDFDLHDVMTRIRDILEVDAVARGNALVVEIDEHIPAWLHGDDKRLGQILLNLASNANKFTSNGSIVLAMELVTQQENSTTIRFSVTDNGIGIPANKIGALFTEFTSLDNSYNRRQGGTGLGLSICQHLVGLMDSEIRVESTFGSGSRFWFEVALPDALEAHGGEHASHPRPNEATPARFSGGGRVLLAEDNPTNAMVASTILVAAGLEVHHVSDGRQAFAAARSGGFDLVLMDISMPELDGMEATRLIRQLPAPSGDLPVIAMTAHALSGDREKFLEAGMNDYITKPIRKTTLLEAVQCHLPPASAEPAATDVSSRVPAKNEASPVIFDEEDVAQFAQDVGEEMLPVLMKQFAADTRTRGEKISAALENRDLQSIQQAAHALNGSAATIGAAGLSHLARQLEHAAGRNDWEQVEALLPQFFSVQAAALREAVRRSEVEPLLDHACPPGKTSPNYP
jgi:PAS domain S-box-containing protein